MTRRKIGILTLNSNENFGNKLQNYALLKTLEKYNYKVDTIWFYKKLITRFSPLIKKMLFINKKYQREAYFEDFTIKYLNRKYYQNNKNISESYNKFVVGSDQVWNYKFKGFNNKYFLDFSPKEKNISYAASIGVSKIDDEYEKIFFKGINNIKYVSLREEAGTIEVKRITQRQDIETLIDPTMLLNKEEWNAILKKPKQMKDKRKYIVNYFLGELSERNKKIINEYAKEKNLFIINILDKNDKFYRCGPSEFLYLIKNAELICTDSFHSSIFSIIFDRSFFIFERENIGWASMNSRIDTLLSKFNLKNRKFNGESITEENLKHDYTEAYKILDIEKEKSRKFLEKALNIDNKEGNLNERK